MKKGIIILVMFVLMVTSVSALTATILTPKEVLRVTSPGDYTSHLSVRNDNDHPVNVTVSGFDDQVLIISNPQATLEPGEEYNFDTLVRLTTPINKTYSLQTMFTDENQSVSLNAKWVILSEFVVTPVIVPEPTPTHSSGGGSTRRVVEEPKEEPTCKTAYDCFDTNNLIGCRRNDCNWCCYTVCTLIDCGHTEQPILQREPEVLNITKTNESQPTILILPSPKPGNTLFYVLFGISLMCATIFLLLFIITYFSDRLGEL